MTDRSIACMIVTHLPVKAEMRRYPQLRGKPVVITESYGSRDLVLDSSPEAQGVTAGMPLAEAMSRCKEASLVQADAPYYNGAFDKLVKALESRSPMVEKAGLGCTYVGLDGLELMYGGEARVIASLLQAAPQEFNPRVGVATGKFPAYVAAVTTKGGRATKVPSDAAGSAGFLNALSIGLLPISWANKTRLHRFGIHTLGQLAALPVGAVQAQLGTDGRRAWQLASGVDNSPLKPHREEQAVEESLTFPSPTVTWSPILMALSTLLGRAFARPEVGGRYVRTATIESHVYRLPPWVKRFGFKEALGSRDRALFALKSRLDSVTLPGPLEDIKLTLAGFTGESGIQTNLFSDVRKQEQLKEMMRQLEAVLGGKPPIYQMKEVEPWSRIPERRQALVPFDP
ncbi:MAG: DNA polymerase Y family protein [Chloroflexi bacterium]|nr:DNA polymerase Y family protein [Chloroflexota bacterium]MDA1271381.1 DNA polymerase Y family protein [Chloroflexota bacterium]